MSRPASFLLVLFTAAISLRAEEAPKWPALTAATTSEPLPGTSALTETGDFSRLLHEANDRFLDAEIVRAKTEREARWKSGDQSSRDELARMLGIDRETRYNDDSGTGNRFEYVSARPNGEKEEGSTRVHGVRWKSFGQVQGDGEIVLPEGEIRADVIYVPEADYLFAMPPAAVTLAASGCRVLVLRLVPRSQNESKLSQREWIQRSAFILGRTMTGYEVLKIQSAVDCLHSDQAESKRPLFAVGHGDGGRLVLFAAALDERIGRVLVSGAFGPREALWREPADRNIFGLLRRFGDAELAALVAPRPLVIEQGTAPAYGYRATKELETGHAKHGEIPGKPALLPHPTDDEVSAELERVATMAPNARTTLVRANHPVSNDALSHLLGDLPVAERTGSEKLMKTPRKERTNELVRHNRLALIDAAADRARYFADLKTDSLENFKTTIESYREKFRTEVIGDFELPLLPPNVRTRPYQVGEKTLSYEVVMDVMESGGEKVIAYGILTLPKELDLSSGERRPVVVCQHGLEGTPQDLIGEAKYDAYKAYATRLAERGFITFAPQNGYKYFDLFRLQQFKAQSIGKTLFSIIVPQHRQITDWLASQSFVDPDKIAFYGLSYGGKSAMRIPPLVDRYCLSICSADFNEWVWKNAATDEASLRYSYANKGEYEIFEWNLGGTFNYAEMAALICPRPFMVERGHFDGVGPDEQVAFEFAKVRNLYAARLGLADRCEIEWFVGPHAINGVGTYDFLHRHLAWPMPEK